MTEKLVQYADARVLPIWIGSAYLSKLHASIRCKGIHPLGTPLFYHQIDKIPAFWLCPLSDACELLLEAADYRFKFWPHNGCMLTHNFPYAFSILQKPYMAQLIELIWANSLGGKIRFYLFYIVVACRKQSKSSLPYFFAQAKISAKGTISSYNS